MRRLWFSLLALVLLAQTSWAAVHACNDLPSGFDAVQVVAAQASPSLGMFDTDPAKDLVADEHCVLAHACHTLAHAVCESVRTGLADSSQCAPIGSLAGLNEAALASRHERPQWPAA